MIMEPERWLPVAGFEGVYEVSDHGRVRSLDREIESANRFGPCKMKIKGRMIAPVRSRQGHLSVHLKKDGKRSVKSLHRLVLETFDSPCPEGMECCHNDDDRNNNHLSNLRWDTSSANRLDSVRLGTHNEARKTHCPQGHEYTPENTYRWPRENSRSCRKCFNDRQRERRSHG